jgi:hypothetical protein
MPQKPNPIASWFEKQTLAIQREAEDASLLQHGVLVGKVREFVINSMLRKFLPEACSIGSGMVFDSNGLISRQMDIIIADSRFPVLRYGEGCNLYPIECVIATIEIKSSLDSKDDIFTALENCHSIHSLSCQWRTSHPIGRSVSAGSPDTLKLDRARRFGFAASPSTYIFSFLGTANAESLQQWVLEWFNGQGHPCFANFPKVCHSLPRVMICGDLVGFLNDGIFNIKEPEGDQLRKILMVFGPSKDRLSILMSHLLNAVCRRIGTESQDAHTQFDIMSHLPIAEQLKNVTNLKGDDRAKWRAMFISHTLP